MFLWRNKKNIHIFDWKKCLIWSCGLLSPVAMLFILLQARCHRLHKALDDYIKFESLTLQHLHDDDHNTTVGTSVLEWQDGCSESSLTARNQSSDHLVKAQTGTYIISGPDKPKFHSIASMKKLSNHHICHTFYRNFWSSKMYFYLLKCKFIFTGLCT